MSVRRIGSGNRGRARWRLDGSLWTAYGGLDALAHIDERRPDGTLVNSLTFPAASELSGPDLWEDDQHILWVAWRDEVGGKGFGHLWNERDGVVIAKRPVYSANPWAFGAGWVAWQSSADRVIYASPLADLQRIERLGTADNMGLSRLLASDVAGGIPSYLTFNQEAQTFDDGSWTVRHLGGGHGALVTHFSEPDAELHLFNTQDANQPWIAGHPNGLHAALLTHGAGDGVRLATFTRADLIRIVLPPVPPLPPLFVVTAGSFWHPPLPAVSELPGHAALVDADPQFAELTKGLRFFPAVAVDATDASITAAKSVWDRVLGVFVNSEQDAPSYRAAVRAAVALQSRVGVPIRPVLSYKGAPDRNRTWGCAYPAYEWEGVEFYPKRGELPWAFGERCQAALNGADGTSLVAFVGTYLPGVTSPTASELRWLARCLPAAVQAIRKEPRVKAIVLWHNDDPHGLRSLAKLEPWLMQAAWAITRATSKPAIVTLPNPVPAPPPPSPPVPPVPPPVPPVPPPPIPGPVEPSPSHFKRSPPMFPGKALPFNVIERFEKLLRRAGEPDVDGVPQAGDGILHNIPQSFKDYFRTLYYDYIFAKYPTAPGSHEEWMTIAGDAEAYVTKAWNEGIAGNP